MKAMEKEKVKQIINLLLTILNALAAIVCTSSCVGHIN